MRDRASVFRSARVFEIVARVLRNGGSTAALCSGLLLTIVGCFEEGTYRLQLMFADDAALESIKEVELFAVERATYSCRGWTDGNLALDDLNLYSRLVVELPVKGEQRLTRVPPRALLFLAEGRDANGARLLLGCTAADVKADSTVDVTVRLEWHCKPQPGGEVRGNQVDDDCDGLTDECGENAECDDKNVCTLDLCADGSCHHNPYPDGLACADMDRCTRRDSCKNGDCRGEPKDCRPYSGQCRTGMCQVDTGACISDPTAEGSECDDGLYCTTADACRSGDCMATALDCADTDGCTRDVCKEYENRCEHWIEPKPGLEGPPGAASCKNGRDDDCDGLTDDADPSCLPCETDEDCGDLNPCTTDACVAGSCRNVILADGVKCDDGRYCTVGDGCNNGACLGAIRDCSAFSGACGVAVCAESEGRCVIEAKPDGTRCDDGLFCTVADRCVRGACLGIPFDCDDDDACTTERCTDTGGCEFTWRFFPYAEGSQKPGSCTNLVDDDCDKLIDVFDPNCKPCTSVIACEDENACTQDSCANGYCENDPVADGTAFDDGNVCTADRCLGLGCENAPIAFGTPCPDALFCNGVEFCDGGGFCQPAVDPCPGADGDANCAESCNEDANSCAAIDPNGSACDDGLFCTAADSCIAGACLGAGDPCAGPDGDESCAESCNEGANRCTGSDPTGSACGDQSVAPCTAADTCDGGGDCLANNSPPGASCDDMLYCNGLDSCDDFGGCAAHAGNPCGAFACDEPSDQCSAVGSTQFIQLTAGGGHTCGLTVEGAGQCWGWDSSGQLGNGAGSPDTSYFGLYPCSQRPVVVDVSGITGSKTWVMLAASHVSHTCGVTVEGAAYCWGLDYWGEVGDGGGLVNAQRPTAVDTSAVTGSKTFVVIGAGEQHCCGLTAEGIVYCWGRPDLGQLGNAASPPGICRGLPCALSPYAAVDTSGMTGSKAFVSLVTGGNHTCGVTAEGAAYCWGYDLYGQVGDGDGAVDSQSPVAVDTSPL